MTKTHHYPRYQPDTPSDYTGNEENYVRELGPDGSIKGYMPIGASSEAKENRYHRRTLITLGAVAAGSVFALATREIIEHLDTSETHEKSSEPIIWKHEVQEGENVWSIVESHYEGTQPVYSPVWMNEFIENNVQNPTSEEAGRNKTDLRPGDILIITDPSITPSPEE